MTDVRFQSYGAVNFVPFLTTSCTSYARKVQPLFSCHFLAVAWNFEVKFYAFVTHLKEEKTLHVLFI